MYNPLFQRVVITGGGDLVADRKASTQSAFLL